MRRRLLAAIAALVLLVAGTVVLLGYVNGADARAFAGARTVEVLVVAEPIPAGTPGDELAALVSTELLPEKAATEGRVTDLTALSGRVATVDLQPGEQLLTSRFARPEDQVAGTVRVPDGLSEISVLLEPARVVGGRVAAGDRVGVYLSQITATGVGQTSAVLHGVLVTQVQGAPAAPAPDAGTETVAAGAPAENILLTVAVTSRDAETIVFGAEHGTLWLSLESEGDETGGTRVLDPSTIYVGGPR
ncbi:MAG: cpaB [Blastococcus sp.]|nr:cpaB [Blastococcus sp.]